MVQTSEYIPNTINLEKSFLVSVFYNVENLFDILKTANAE